MNGPDLSYQQRLTVYFVSIYFLMIFAFIGLGIGLFLADDVTISDKALDIISWVQTVLGILIGVLTSSVKDQLQFHYGSSDGSKTKDRPPQT